METIKVIGAGLAGCEAAWQLAQRGFSVALYEMKYSHEVAESIAINEAVELAKRFSEPASARFVNGMLGAISRGEQPEGKKDQPASKPEQKADEDGEKQDS